MGLREILFVQIRELLLSECIDIKSSLGDYTIEVCDQQRIFSIEDHDSHFYLLDSIVADLYYGSSLRHSHIHKLEASEKNKTLLFVMEVIEWLRNAGATRQSKLVVVGGGVVQDVGTMAASLYMRGIDWCLVPTTLLSMVDSCIGGKSSINVGAYKNIAGNFYPPSEIKIYPRYCDTLDDKKRLEGVCEALKIFYASDPDEFTKEFLGFPPNHWLQTDNLSGLIYRSLERKKVIIEADEFDNGERLLLNFGHTFGHAIEAASNYTMPHGVAVGLGMMLAVDYMGSTNTSDNAISLRQFIKSLLSLDQSIAEDIKAVDPERACQAFESDKKHELDAYRLIVPDGNKGCLKVIKINKTAIRRNTIKIIFEGMVDLL